MYNEKLYREYANEFWVRLNEVFLQKPTDCNYLPIVFERKPDDKKYKYINGFTKTHVNTRTQLSSLFPVVFIDDESCDKLKETIRHEIIHYYLGLHYKHYQDDTALFWVLCDLFEGGAYIELSERNENIFKTAIPYIKRLYNHYDKCEEKSSVTIHLGVILTAVDDAETNLEKNISGFKNIFEYCCKKCGC
ncbi:MAG: hypothetical protein IIX14_05735 [Clostridia bacterium]|nr:hypothetical protein [Clostridia bacterium]